jgi:UTP--glucose-1-phosphate uridylyltransferase
MILDEVDARTRAVLERFGFDPGTFEELRARVASGALSPASNVARGTVEPPLEEDIARLPEPGSHAWVEARAAGIAALGAGRVAQVVLAGGMATRFGGVVKGAVEALDGRSFLSWKLGETARLAQQLGIEIPVAVMTSFQTEDETRAHVAGLGVPEPLSFSQYVSLRLTEDGELFRHDGLPSLYAPGHGDLLDALRRSGTLAALRERGVEHLAVSNVDNLGARLDPAVLGAHVLAGRSMTAEVAAKEGDLGGAPARVDGRLGLLEGPQFPPDFDQERIRVFNTNTTMLALDAIDRPFDLPWLYVRKSVDGRSAVQLERLYHQVAWELATTFLEVSRSGPRGRFFPIKEPEDLERSRPALREMLAASVLD